MLFPKDGAAHARGVVRKVFRFDANPLFDLAIRGGERAELATEFPRVTVLLVEYAVPGMAKRLAALAGKDAQNYG